MNEPKSDYNIKIPRPDKIKVTATKPTIEELKEYRAAWLKEAEDNGTIDDLFLIVKTFGVIPERGMFPSWPPLRRFEFTDGDSDYVILLDRVVWGVGGMNGKNRGDTLIEWERVFVIQGGTYIKEIVYGKKLVQYYRHLNLAPHGNMPSDHKGRLESNLFVPGYWEGLIGVFAKDARYEITDGRKKKVDNERKSLLKDLNLI